MSLLIIAFLVSLTVFLATITGCIFNHHRFAIRVRNGIIFTIVQTLSMWLVFSLAGQPIFIPFWIIWGLILGMTMASVSDDPEGKLFYWQGIIPGLVMMFGYSIYLLFKSF